MRRKEFDKWAASREVGLRGFLSKFLRHTCAWHAALLGGLLAAQTYHLHRHILRESQGASFFRSAVTFLLVFLVTMLAGCLAGLLIWRLNEWRFLRATPRHRSGAEANPPLAPE